MHPPYFKLMDEVQEGLRYVFQTDTKYTLCMSGTGHAGMEATIANLVEPGETVVVGNKGIWGMRVADLAARYGANVVEMTTGGAPRSFSLEEITSAVETHKPALLFLCQGESSMGVHQSFAGIGEVCRANNTLFLADTVCTLGGIPFFADAWGVDAMYSGSQKALAAPPGAAPLMLGDRAIEKLMTRKTKVASYQNDLTLIGDYWGWYDKRFYHHTGMVSMTYAMREALEVVKAEGLDAMWQRHTDMHNMLWDGLKEMGLKPYVPAEQDRLVTVNTITVPEGVDAVKVITNAMDKYKVEIAGGLGPSLGKVWRVGILGYNAQPQNIQLVLEVFRDGLKQQGKL